MPYQNKVRSSLAIIVVLLLIGISALVAHLNRPTTITAELVQDTLFIFIDGRLDRIDYIGYSNEEPMFDEVNFTTLYTLRLHGGECSETSYFNFEDSNGDMHYGTTGSGTFTYADGRVLQASINGEVINIPITCLFYSPRSY